MYGFLRVAGLPPVTVSGLEGVHGPGEGWPHRAHAHDFVLLGYVERGAVRLRVDDRTWELVTGDLIVVAPGQVVTVERSEHLAEAVVWTTSFPPDALERRSPGTFGSWRAHPLLFPFVGGSAGGVQRLPVPEAAWGAWLRRVADLERERERWEGHAEAALRN